ncbi:MAG: hypothetical protein AAB614_02135 [Patescibacteria group bacterium]
MLKDINLELIKNQADKFIMPFLAFLKKYVEAFLIMIFLLMVIFWGYVFYIYAYNPVFTDPKVVVTTLKVNDKMLKIVVDDVKEREKRRVTIQLIDVKNPFQDATENITKIETATSTTSVIR